MGKIRNTCFDMTSCCVLTTQCTNGLHMMLTVSYDYVAKQYYPISLCNGNAVSSYEGGADNLSI